MRILVPVLATTTLLGQAPQALAETERAFAKMAMERGISPAFSAYFAPDGLLFRPRPTSAHQVHDGRPDNGSRLLWEPSFAEVSASGELGWTTGPWHWRKHASDPAPAAHGHFVSVWRKQADGNWRVALDLGISHAEPPSHSLVLAPEGKAVPQTPLSADQGRRELLRAETHFQLKASSQDLVAALTAYGAEDLRTYREGLLPGRSKKASLALVAFGDTFLRAELEGSEVSAAGDLGYTYGLAQYQDLGTRGLTPFTFVRIWRKAPGGWQIVLDIQIPAAPAKPA